MEILSIVLQSLLALAFLVAGCGKIFGAKMHVEGFDHWRLPQWFRVVTGLVELVGAAALIYGYWEPGWMTAGALLLGVTAVGGVVTHLRAKDSFNQMLPILLLGIIAFVLFFLHYSEFTDFTGLS